MRTAKALLPLLKRRALNVVFALLLAACSDNDGISGPPAAPVLSLTPQAVKTFHFVWTDVAGEQVYWLLENPTGHAGYSAVAQIAANAEDHDLEVFLPGRINASYILQACNAFGCTDSAPVHVSGTLVEAVGYFKGTNTGRTALFGQDVALSADGGTLAVGASGSTNAVYVFVRAGGAWEQQAYLKASNTGGVTFNLGGDSFGFSVALSADGDTLAVAAPLEDSGATGIGGDQTNDSALRSGAVYVFVRAGSAWEQQAYVKASNTERDDRFGASLALSADGSTLAAGARAEDSSATGIGGDQTDNSVSFNGAVYVY